MQDEGRGVFSQAERSFFILRYAAPGFTFILISVLTSYPTLNPILRNLFPIADGALIAAFLAFFSLLGGGAIGFLVSQVWYFIDFLFLYGSYGRLKKLREDLKREYRLNNERFDQTLFIDYIFRRFSGNKMQLYAQRRYDLMHTCGSTLVAIVLGYLFGLSIRINIFGSHPSLGYMTYDIQVLRIVAFLSFFLFIGWLRVSTEHARIIDFAVRRVVEKGRFPRWKAWQVIPEEYFR